MANINELLARAAALRDETALNSISPERAGGIMYDTLVAMNELWLQQGAALVISKIYASVAAMEADTEPVSDLTGQPLRPGQIVVIASSDSDNGSVYRYNGTESPSWTLVGSIGNIEPVDNLESDSTTLPLAAHQGKVLDGKISQLGQELIKQVNGVLNFTDNSVSCPDSVLYVQKHSGGSVVPIQFSSYTLTGTERLVLHTTNWIVEKVSAATDVLSTDIVLLGLNADGKFGFGVLYQLYSNQKIEEQFVKKSKTIVPISFDLTTTSKGSGKIVAAGAPPGSSVSTGKYLVLPNDKKLIINSATDISSFLVAFIFYDKDYVRISDSGWISNVPKDTDYDVNANVSGGIPDDAIYMKMVVYSTTATPLIIPQIQMYAEGAFVGEPYRYNIRPDDDGYQTLEIAVDVADVTSDEGQTATVQDWINIKNDFGLLALPETYTNTGRPTRMIIYCHGAGVHYTKDTTRFPEGASNFGVEPEYWLAEGYAVMDIEGDPFDNVNKHFFIPQAIQCYISAYEWVVRNYNICKDGVFLGGRSMGGSMALDIIHNGQIPVLACCPVAGGFNPVAMWNAMGGASYRQFVAEKIGLPNASSITWTNNNPMTSAEYNYLKANFKQLLQFTPLWKMTSMVPDASVLLNDAFNVAYSTASLPAEAAVYNALHLRCGTPFKFFISTQDTSAVAARSSEYVYNMMRNAGTRCEYRVFTSGGHAFELEPQNRVASYTTRTGKTLTDVPIVYIEALQFWRRYELQK